MPFTNIIGQDTAVRSLKNIIADDQARGSFLFLGPNGVGKRTVAIEFAKAINCENKDAAPCSCISCKKIAASRHPDVFMLFPEGASFSIKIEKIREITYQAGLMPYEGRKKVFIINDAEHLTEEAQNAMLRLLEEPNASSILILTCSSISGLLPTIISRCKIVRFYSLSRGDIQAFLKSYDLEETQVQLFSHMAMGSIGRALGFKDKDIIGQRDEVINDFFMRKSSLFKESVLDRQNSEDIRECLYMLLYWYRDLLISKFIDTPDALLNIDRSTQISSYASKLSKESLERNLSAIMDTIGYVRRNINRKIALFNMVIGLNRN